MGILEDIGLKEDPKAAKKKREIERKVSVAKDELDDLEEKVESKKKEIEALEDQL